MMSFCSPNTTHEHCFNLQDLRKIATIYNKTHNNKIPLNTRSTENSIYKHLNNRLKNILGDKSHFLWADYLSQFYNHDETDYSILSDLSDKRLMPKKPEEWQNNPKTWLSNFDIDKVLIHYHNTPKYRYHFIGVVPIDFGVKNQQGSCKYDERCQINMKDIISKKKQFMGLVSNLDTHDGPGYHWTSLFFIIDPSLPNYGIYYYDSVGKGMPELMKLYVIDVCQQLYAIYKLKPRCFVSKVRHQHKNTECGMFSIWYQIRWIDMLLKNPKNVTHKQIIDVKINDDLVSNYRDILFRPTLQNLSKK